MIVNRKRFYTGLGIMVIFAVLLVAMFLPIFDGKNMLRNIDTLYNSISKDSANYISQVLEVSEEYVGVVIEAGIEMESQEEAEQTALLYEESDAQVVVSEARLEISGDLGHILINAIEDAEILYNNDADKLTEKYGYDGLRVIYNWHKSLDSLHDELERQDMISASKAVAKVNEKGLEPAYNLVVGTLFFYIFYTVLYGFGIMYLFEGWGLKTEH